MTSWKPMFVALSLAIAAVPGALAGTSPKPVDDAAVIVAPYAGLSLEAGGKHVVGYYVAVDGGCKVTIAIADQFRDDVDAPAAGSRLHTLVAAGHMARVETSAGPSLEFVCAPGATTMSGRVLQRTAYAPVVE